MIVRIIKNIEPTLTQHQKDLKPTLANIVFWPAGATLAQCCPVCGHWVSVGPTLLRCCNFNAFKPPMVGTMLSQRWPSIVPTIGGLNELGISKGC